MNKQIENWLNSSDTPLCSIKNGNWTYVFLRVQKDADFDYLYCQCEFGDRDLARGPDLQYVGIYCKLDQLIYDARYDLMSMEDMETLKERTAPVLSKQLEQAVRKKVEADIANDRSNLQVTELSDTNLKRYLAEDFYARGQARSLYLEHQDPPVFHCDYKPEEWSDDGLLCYIRDGNTFVGEQAEWFCNHNQEKMLYIFLMNDKIAEEYKALLANPSNPVHCMRKIMSAMKASQAKTVNVTVLKDGTAFTFKTDADDLRRDCGSHYSSWYIAAQDRKRFEETFGKNAEYTPQEIVRITYARTVLYEAGEHVHNHDQISYGENPCDFQGQG